MVSVNQVKHFFLLKDWKGVRNSTSSTSQVSALGDIELVETKKGLMFRYMGPGGLITSDYIDPSKVNYATYSSATSKPLHEVTLTLKNNGLVLGEDYVINILISNYIALGDESTLQKFAAVHCSDATDTSAFYKNVAYSFVRNFSRDVNNFFKFYLQDASNRYLVTMAGIKSGTVHDMVNDADVAISTVTATGVVIVEQSQESDYVKGEVPVTTVNFNVYPQTVLMNGEDFQPWNNVDEETTGSVRKDNKTATINGTQISDDVVKIYNGYEISDIEYFCAGERGDMLRGVGYPKNFRTKYAIDTPAQTGYATLDISYYLRMDGVPEMRSNKQILIVCEDGAKLTTLAQALETASNSAIDVEGV